MLANSQIYLAQSLTLGYTYIGQVHPTKNAYVRRGFSLALGVLDFRKMKDWIPVVVRALDMSATVQVD
jgi:hypothetical protein